MVDRRADIGWLSQYPSEEEILFAPLTGLEVQDEKVDGRTLVVGVRMSVNMSAQTIEQVQGKRWKMLQDMQKTMAFEVQVALGEGLVHQAGLTDDSLAMLAYLLSRAWDKPADAYNTDPIFSRAIADGLDAKRQVLDPARLLAWMTDEAVSESATAIVPLLFNDEVAVREAAAYALSKRSRAEALQQCTSTILERLVELCRASGVAREGMEEAGQPTALPLRPKAAWFPNIREECTAMVAPGPHREAPQLSDVRSPSLKPSHRESIVEQGLALLSQMEVSMLVPSAGLLTQLLTSDMAPCRAVAASMMCKVLEQHTNVCASQAGPLLNALRDAWREADDEGSSLTALLKVVNALTGPCLSREQHDDVLIDLVRFECSSVSMAAAACLGRSDEASKVRRRSALAALPRGTDAERTTAASALRAMGASALDLKRSGFSAKDLFAAGFGLAEGLGFTAVELRQAGYPPRDLVAAKFRPQDILSALRDPSELREAGAPSELIDLGFDAGHLKSAGYTCRQLADDGIKTRKLAAFYTFDEMLDAGFPPQVASQSTVQ